MGNTNSVRYPREYAFLANILSIVMTTYILREKFTECIHNPIRCVFLAKWINQSVASFLLEEIEAEFKWLNPGSHCQKWQSFPRILAFGPLDQYPYTGLPGCFHVIFLMYEWLICDKKGVPLGHVCPLNRLLSTLRLFSNLLLASFSLSTLALGNFICTLTWPPSHWRVPNLCRLHNFSWFQTAKFRHLLILSTRMPQRHLKLSIS